MDYQAHFAQPQLDDRGRAPVLLREADLSPQRYGASRNAAACLAGLRTRLIDIRTDLRQLQIARRMTARSQNRFGALVVESTADNSRDYREDWQPQR
jgi:hypothetical protein